MRILHTLIEQSDGSYVCISQHFMLHTHAYNNKIKIEKFISQIAQGFMTALLEHLQLL